MIAKIWTYYLGSREESPILWHHRGISCYIVEEFVNARDTQFSLRAATTGNPVTPVMSSEEIRRNLLDSSVILPIDQWPVWAESDLQMDIGL